MRRDLSAHLVLEVHAPATLALAVGPAASYTGEERLELTLDGTAVTPRELPEPHGGRLHVLDAPSGTLVVDLTARVDGTAAPDPEDGSSLGEVARLRYLRPSRYCESDTLGPTARSEFAGLAGADLLAAVSSWVGTQLAYVPGSSLPTDGAVRTLLARRGVCRDYAHLVVALLRALDVPARLAGVYAPGLDPMDFHAVAEAWVPGPSGEEGWHVVDATTLAPRGTLVRVATGRDASDTAFLSSYGGAVTLRELEVTAVADALPDDDVRALARIR